jgi:hypothetical protein
MVRLESIGQRPRPRSGIALAPLPYVVVSGSTKPQPMPAEFAGANGGPLGSTALSA